MSRWREKEVLRESHALALAAAIAAAAPAGGVLTQVNVTLGVLLRFSECPLDP